MLQLQILICTFGREGLSRVSKMTLPKIENVSYLVSLQNPNGEKIIVPESLLRNDVEIYEHNDSGLSNNRNAAIDRSTGDIIIIADDDLDYDANALKQVIKAFETDTTLDFATFSYSGDDNKVYPDYSFEIKEKLPRGYYITSFEIALRKSSIPDDIRFSTLLGIGAPEFGAGEENVFVYRLIKSGYKGRFFPIKIVVHNGITTGIRVANNAILRAQGVWFWIRYGYIMGFMRLVRDVPRRNASMVKSFCQMSIGFFRAHKFFIRNGEERHT